jgi:NAD+ kinase
VAVIGLLAHAQREDAQKLAAETAEWLRAKGHQAVLLDGSATSLGPVTGLDLAVSLGGDGTMLRTIDLVGSAGVPVLGVNLGHLGYLTIVEPEGLRPALERFLAHDYQVEARMTLDVSARPAAGQDEPLGLRRTALNDVVLQRPFGGHTVRAELSVNGAAFLEFAADSLIVATPTGSTAYNLSARGPIVSPRARVLVVTPVAPHSLFDRSLVLAAEEDVEITPIDGRAAEIVVDGSPAGTLAPGQRLSCRPGARDALLVTFGDRDFHHILKQKFHLSDG